MQIYIMALYGGCQSGGFESSFVLASRILRCKGKRRIALSGVPPWHSSPDSCVGPEAANMSEHVKW